METFDEQIQQRVLALVSKGASDAEIDAFLADAMSAKASFGPTSVEPVSTITGMTPSQAQARGEAGAEALQTGVAQVAREVPVAALRYGGPVAAGIATAPLSAPVAAASMVGAFGLSEAAAQTLQNMMTGEEYRPKQIAVSSAFGLAPPLSIAQTNRFFGMAVNNLKASQGVANFLANAGLQTAASETARIIESDSSLLDAMFQKPEGFTDSALRFGVPALTSAIGSRFAYKTASTEQAAERAAKISSERFGRRFVIGELLEGYSEMEKKAYADRLPLVVNAVENLGADIGPALVTAFKDLPNSQQVADALVKTGAIGKLEKLKASVNSAEAAKQQANDAYTAAAREARFDAPVFEEQARKAGVEAARQYALFEEGIQDVFGIKPGDVLMGSATRLRKVQDFAESAENAVKTGISSLYENVGIGINDPVMTSELLIAALNKNVPSENARVEIIQAIDAARRRIPTLIKPDGTLSRDSFLRIRNEIAAELVSAGQRPDSANRTAAQAYASVLEASEAFMQATAPEKLVALRKANSANRAVEQAISGMAPDQRESTIQLLRKGDIPGVVKLIESPQALQVVDEIEAYAAAMRGVGDGPSMAAASRFKDNTYKAIRDELVGSSLLGVGGIDDASRRVDAEALSKRLDKLRSNKFPVSELRLGTSDEIATLARLSNDYGLSVERVNAFLDDAAKVGTRGAEARVRFQKAYESYLTSGTPGESSRNLVQLRKVAKDAKLDFDTQSRLMADARRDPLVQLFSRTDLGLSTDFSKNTRFSYALLDAGPTVVKRLIDSLEGKAVKNSGLSAAEVLNRSQIADTLRKSVARDVFLNSVAKSIGPDDKSLAFTQITNFFYGNSPAAIRQRESFMALLGKDTFNDLKDKWASPISTILKTSRDYGSKIYDFAPEMTIAASGVSFGMAGAGGNASPVGAQRGVILKNWFRDVSKAVRSYRMHEAYELFVDPVSSKAYREFNYNLNKFLNSTPRNLAAYQLAQRRDQEEQANNPQQSPAR